MENEMIEKIKVSIKNIDEKLNRIYFFVQDTKGNAKASIRYIYEMALTLKDNGHNVIMLYEKKEYTPVTSWLKGSYDELQHQSLEGQNLAIAPEDVLVIPEIFGFIMEQVKNLPCGKIVLCQAYDHILEPTLHENFESSKFPAKTLIGVSAREQREGLNIIKQFYLKYPQYRFFTFKDLRGLSQDDFAKGLQDCLLGVWIDPTSGFGTFPLECMKSGVPVVGKIPNLKPGWMSEKNGIWIDNQNQLGDVIADVVQTWLEDNVLQDLYTEGFNTAEKFTNQENFKTSVVDIFNSFINKRKDAFEAQITQETV